MTNRAVSSVLDVSVCLLLISASALTLTHATTTSGPNESDRADDTLDVLTTSTAWVEYESRPTSGSNRTVHGTLATLLAAGAVANETAHGPSTAPQSDAFRRAVAGAVHRAAARMDVRMQVIAQAHSSSKTSGQGRFVVGRSPPQSAGVHAASTTVPWELTETAQAGSVAEVRLTVRTWSP